MKTVLENFRLSGYEQEEANMEVQVLKRRMPIHMGSVSDPFQILEKEERVTHSMLRLLADHEYPTIVSTKGDLILEERYIKEFEKMPCVLQVTISTLDEKIAKVLEPGAPSPRRRLEVVKELSDRGFYTTVRAEPYYPDMPYEEFFTEVADAGAKHVSWAPLRVYAPNQDVYKTALGEKWLEGYLSKAVGHVGYKKLDPEHTIENSKKFVDIVHKLGMTAGAAGDFDALQSDSYCCCAPVEKLKGFENTAKYNLYWAARIAKEKGSVTYDDMKKEWRPEGPMWIKAAQSYTKELDQWSSVEKYFLHQWNRNKTTGIVLSDIDGISYAGKDGEGNAMFKYGKSQKLGGLFD